jgi:hypothetical protein
LFIWVALPLQFVLADEGMWLFTNPPTEQLRGRYGFDPTPDWLDHVQKSAVRFSSGGSGAFVSAEGLVLTNHHVAIGDLERLSAADRNLLDTGFLARTRDEELPCSALEINLLWNIEDVTERINGAVASGLSPADAESARRAMISTIETESENATGLDCQVVTLYRGERFHLYQYKRFTDVRIVWAPEHGIAYFGGDTDNFEYPRYALDAALYRVYENGQPYRPEHFLRWGRHGASAGDLVFVPGHPGRTQRLNTLDHLRFMRDIEFPSSLRWLSRREVELQVFSAQNAEFARIASGEMLGVQNRRKAFTGILAGLQDPAIVEQKAEREASLRDAVNTNPEYNARWGDAWDHIADARENYRGFYDRHRTGLHSTLFGIALTLVRLSEELEKPSADRLPEYGDARLDSLYLSLYSPDPIYDDLEINRLASSLSHMMETFGGDDPFVQRALGGLSPRAQATALVRGTQLKDVQTRKALAEGGRDAIAASTDPMIRLAADLDPEFRMWQKRYEDDVESVEKDAYAKIAAAHFAVNGEDAYPDATFTLRLAFGTVQGYAEDGRDVPPFTTFDGLYDRANARSGQPGFELPQRWIDRKGRLNLDTPFNFVCSADITGGNSGSPVINRDAELVGLVFDGNLHSLANGIAYSETQARAVAVDSRAIIEALRKVYKTRTLVDEIPHGANGS